MALHEYSFLDCDGQVLVTFGGELDLANTPQIEEKLDSDLSGSRAQHVVVDMTEVKFMDSYALRMLLRTGARLEEAGQEMQVIAESRQVRRVLELTGADQQLKLVASPA